MVLYIRSNSTAYPGCMTPLQLHNFFPHHQEYVDLAVRLGMDKAFRERARAEIESGYFLSLHRHIESAAEWGQFFRRALRAARY